MKKKLALLLSIIMTLTFTSCANTDKPSSGTTTTAAVQMPSTTESTTVEEKTEKYSIEAIQKISKRLDIPKSVGDSIVHIGIIDDFLIYYEKVGEWPQCSKDYYKYNLKTNEKIKLGTLNNTNTTMDSYACIDKNIYFAEDGEGGVAHCKLDTVNNKLTVMNVDKGNSLPLIRTKPINNSSYVELGGGFKKENLGEYTLTLCGTDGSRKVIVSCLYDYEKKDGMSINAVTAADEFIYAVVYKSSGETLNEPFICTYDLSGKEISSVSIADFAEPDGNGKYKYESIDTISVIDDRVFLGCTQNGCIVLKKTSDGYVKDEELSKYRVRPLDEFTFPDGERSVYWMHASWMNYSSMCLFDSQSEEMQVINNFPNAGTVAFDKKCRQAVFTFSSSDVAPIPSHDGLTYLLELEDLKKLYP